MMRCGDCGNGSRFYCRQSVEEVVEVDSEGGFVAGIDAATKDRHETRCYLCDSDNITFEEDR